METRMILSRGCWGIALKIQRQILRQERIYRINSGFLRVPECVRHSSTTSELSRDEKEEISVDHDKEKSKDYGKTNNITSPDSSKLLKVAIIGLPNAGKSTLVNSLLNLGVCPVSRRVHTTRTNQKAVLLEGQTQIVFVDTPGLVNMSEIKRFAFKKDFVFGPEKSIQVADVVAVIHDISNPISRNKLDPRILSVLKKFPEKDSILILNKVDVVKSKHVFLDTVRILSGGLVGGRPIQLKKSVTERRRDQEKSMEMENLLSKAKKRMIIKANSDDKDLMDAKMTELAISSFSGDEISEGLHLQGWKKFHDIFMISALDGDGIDLLKKYFTTNARHASWMFNEDVLTDVDPPELVVRIIKSKLLDHLPQEIPYQLKPKIEFWESNRNGELRIIVLLKCPNERYLGRVVGNGAVVINRITSESESLLVNLLRVPVNLHIKAYTDEKSK